MSIEQGTNFKKMKYLRNSTLAAMMIIFVAAACQKDELDDPIIVQVNTQFNIAYNQQVSVKDENLVLNFTEVKEDSRCAVDVQCVWEGRLVVVIKANSKPLEMSIGGDAQPVSEIEGYRITLVEVVEPSPNSQVDPNHSDYIVALNIEKI